MIKDPFVEEVRKEREANAAKFSYDLRAIYEDLKKQERENKSKFVTLTPRIADYNCYFAPESMETKGSQP